MSHRLGYIVLLVISLIFLAGCAVQQTHDFVSLYQSHNDQTQSFLYHYISPHYLSGQAQIWVTWSGMIGTIHWWWKWFIDRQYDSQSYIENRTWDIVLLRQNDQIPLENQHQLQIKGYPNNTYLRILASTGSLDIASRLGQIADLTGENQARYHLTPNLYQWVQWYQTYLSWLIYMLHQSWLWIITASQQTSLGTNYDLILDTDYLKNLLAIFYGSWDRSQQVQQHYLLDHYFKNLILTGRLEKNTDSVVLSRYGSQGSWWIIDGKRDREILELSLKRNDILDQRWKMTCTKLGSCQILITHGSLPILQWTITYTHRIKDQSHTSHTTIDRSGPNISFKSNIDIQAYSSNLSLGDDHTNLARNNFDH